MLSGMASNDVSRQPARFDGSFGASVPYSELPIHAHRFSSQKRQGQWQASQARRPGGLYLYVTPQGARLWRFDYRFAGKRNTASFGAYPSLSLIEARKRRDRAKELIADGVDPMTAKQAARARINGHAENSFETFARSWFERNKARWLPHYAELPMTRFETLVFPEIGRQPLAPRASIAVTTAT